MPLWVIRYLLPAIAAALVIGVVVYWYNTQLDKAYTNGKNAAEKICSEETVPAVKKLAREQCDATTQLATEACNALQTRYDAIDARYNRLLKQSTNRKPSSVTKDPGRANEAAGTPVQPVPAGDDWLDQLGLRRDNDRTSARLITLQSVVCGIYKLNKREDLLPPGACQAP